MRGRQHHFWIDGMSDLPAFVLRGHDSLAPLAMQDVFLEVEGRDQFVHPNVRARWALAQPRHGRASVLALIDHVTTPFTHLPHSCKPPMLEALVVVQHLGEHVDVVQTDVVPPPGPLGARALLGRSPGLQTLAREVEHAAIVPLQSTAKELSRCGRHSDGHHARLHSVVQAIRRQFLHALHAREFAAAEALCDVRDVSTHHEIVPPLVQFHPDRRVHVQPHQKRSVRQLRGSVVDGSQLPDERFPVHDVV
mmetsp:Transcript_57230/g.148715  ORF Transcript_57230/g.148715 Transcript_57230/m.148715 type:complete len:250 (+) Transcript_57230:311-1060(+)